MKKTIACICLLVLVLSMTCSAFAWQTPTNAWWFNLNNVQCVNTSTLKWLDLTTVSDAEYPYKSMANNFYDLPTRVDTSGRIYVYHSVTGGGGNEFTNLIHAVRYDDGSYVMPPQRGSLCGSKWVTPLQWIPIQGSEKAIPDDRIYGVAVRGNTKHYEKYGATNINFYIGIEPNQ